MPTKTKTKPPPFAPCLDRLLIRRGEKERESQGGIIIPDKVKQKACWGTVLAVGPGKRDSVGAVMPLPFGVGDLVWFNSYAGDLVEYLGEGYVLIEEKLVLMVETDGGEGRGVTALK